MDGMTLLHEARAAGLSVTADGDRLVIRGPRRAEHIARRLMEHKPLVVAALHSMTSCANPWEFWSERPLIRQYDGKLPRTRAGAIAFQDLIERLKRAGTHLWN